MDSSNASRSLGDHSNAAETPPDYPPLLCDTGASVPDSGNIDKSAFYSTDTSRRPALKTSSVSSSQSYSQTIDEICCPSVDNASMLRQSSGSLVEPLSTGHAEMIGIQPALPILDSIYQAPRRLPDQISDSSWSLPEPFGFGSPLIPEEEYQLLTAASLTPLPDDETIKNSPFVGLDLTLGGFSSDFQDAFFGPQNPQSRPPRANQLSSTNEPLAFGAALKSTNDELNFSCLLPPSSPRRKHEQAIKPGRYRCRYCPTSFTLSCELRRHTTTHTLPNKCPHANCNYAFAMRKDLDRHLATRKHRNAPGGSDPPKYYVCGFEGCKYNLEGFTRRDHLLRHTRKVHRSHSSSGFVANDMENGNRHRE
ncbi:hypothetical protein AOQ84DRAFT_225550 [Glonium stellatum]|uniref:C2H2-type domain-containing protein n=1 Tax=Glonium stellatum TaxID=574774 RepID=A0A8E2EUG4_9PEZI|nr:hypothetical protein AOQ84DRAFT_225550 [Glonium stellatum]